MAERETNILACTQVPHSVWENFISCLFHKLSRQEKNLNGNNFFKLFLGYLEKIDLDGLQKRNKQKT